MPHNNLNSEARNDGINNSKLTAMTPINRIDKAYFGVSKTGRHCRTR